MIKSHKDLKDSFEKDTILVMGIRFYCRPIGCIVEKMIGICLEKSPKENRHITATGAHGLSLSRKDKQFAEILQKAYLNIPDGIPAVWVGRFKGKRSMERCPGPDFFKHVMRETAQYPIRHYFLGGREGIAEELKKSCKDNFNNVHVVGTSCPPFRKITEEEIQLYAQDINLKKADILWIGVSTPKQEFLAERLSHYANVHFIITVGAAFDFHTGNLKKAPEILQNIGLEWAYRLYKEPKRLLKRYSIAVPEVIFYGIKDVIKHKLYNQKRRRKVHA